MHEEKGSHSSRGLSALGGSRIPLGGQRKAPTHWALVDSEDVERVGDGWRLDKCGYARRTASPRKGRPAGSLARTILGLEPGDRRHVIYLNKDRLDCRKANLRLESVGTEGAIRDGASYRLPLRGRDGRVRAWTVIDADDHDAVVRWRWTLTPSGYAMRGTNIEGRVRSILLHRELLGLPRHDPREVDHIDRDPLNNRRSNLRIVTDHEQMQNKGVYRSNTSGHRGVNRTATGKWMARVRVGGVRHYLGTFATEREAAEAARWGRVRLMPHSTD